MYRSVNDPKRQSPYDLQNNSSTSKQLNSSKLFIDRIPVFKEKQEEPECKSSSDKKPSS